MADLQPTTSCERCGYDLRGIDSKFCPECGSPQDFIIVRITDPQQFHFAFAALETENLVSRFINPGGSMGIIAELTGDRSGWLWVRTDSADRAEEILDDLGIATSLGARPIVDRSEPVCPKCTQAVDVGGPEVCPHCHTAFHWIDVQSAPLDPSGHTCLGCGYELTGNTSGNCPECGHPVDVSILAGLSLDNHEAANANDASSELRKWINGVCLYLLALGIYVVAVIVVATMFNPIPVVIWILICLGVTFITVAAGSVLALIARLGSGR